MSVQHHLKRASDVVGGYGAQYPPKTNIICGKNSYPQFTKDLLIKSTYNRVY